MSDHIQDERDTARVLEGDSADQRSLQAFTVGKRSVFIEKIAVLLTWKRLGKRGMQMNGTYSPGYQVTNCPGGAGGIGWDVVMFTYLYKPLSTDIMNAN